MKPFQNTPRSPVRCVQARHPTPLGEAVLCASVGGPASGLVGLWFAEGQRHGPAPDQLSSWAHDPAHPVLQAAMRQLDAYFAGRLTAFDLPLDVRAGTPFQQSVWRALRAIAPGSTRSYGEIGRRIGQPQAVRAVGAAVGRNPVGIVVPCHRVIGADGSLTGYAGRLDRKVALLRLEGAIDDSVLSSTGPTIERTTRITAPPAAHPPPAPAGLL